MFAINRCTAQFENAETEGLIGREAEFALGVVAEIARGSLARLHAVGSDDAVRELFFDEQMLAEEIEVIGIEAGLVGAFETLTHLDVEDAKAQTAGSIAIFSGFCQTEPVPSYLGVNTRCNGRRQGWQKDGGRKREGCGRGTGGL